MEEIEKRREEIREKILKKSKERASVYLGIVLIVVIFAFLLFSNLSQEKPQSMQNISISIEKPVKKTSETEKKEEVKLNIKPPIPEEFNESKFVKASIVDDAQSFYWSNIEPTSVYFEDSLDKVSGRDSLKIKFLMQRRSWSFAEKRFTDLQDWNNAKFISFWFKGNDSGMTFNIYIYFDKKWSNYVYISFRDIYQGWQRFVFSTEKNIFKNGDIDWSKVWAIKITTSPKTTGEFYFDDFAMWIPKEKYKITNETPESKTYGMGDTIIKGSLAVTLDRFYDRFTVRKKPSLVEDYSRVDITVKNIGNREVKLSLAPYKPVLIDDNGDTYDYVYVKVLRGYWVPHEDQLKLDILYPNASRSGAIFFSPTVTLKTKKVKLILYLNNEKYEYVFDRF